VADVELCGEVVGGDPIEVMQHEQAQFFGGHAPEGTENCVALGILEPVVGELGEVLRGPTVSEGDHRGVEHLARRRHSEPKSQPSSWSSRSQ
jgi:hypothetical protein